MLLTLDRSDGDCLSLGLPIFYTTSTSSQCSAVVAAMDVVQAVSGYISKMVGANDGASGTASAKMKILLLDSETVRHARRRFYLKSLTESVVGVHCVNSNYTIRSTQP